MKLWTNLLKSLFPFFLIELVTTVVTFMASMMLFAVLFATGTYSSLDGLLQTLQKALTSSNFLMGVSAAYAVICSIIFGLLYQRQTKHFQRVTGPNGTVYPSTPAGGKPGFTLRGISPLAIPGIALVAVSCQYLSNYIVAIVSAVSPESISKYEKLMESSGLSDGRITVLVVLYSVILGPICEELAFRGLTLGYSSRFLPFWAANLFQAFLFGLVHMNVVQFAYAFALGLVLGWLYHKTGSIWITIFTHMAFNAISEFFASWMVTGRNPYTFCLILFLSMAACYGGMKLVELSAEKRA